MACCLPWRIKTIRAVPDIKSNKLGELNDSEVFEVSHRVQHAGVTWLGLANCTGWVRVLSTYDNQTPVAEKLEALVVKWHVVCDAVLNIRSAPDLESTKIGELNGVVKLVGTLYAPLITGIGSSLRLDTVL